LHNLGCPTVRKPFGVVCAIRLHSDCCCLRDAAGAPERVRLSTYEARFLLLSFHTPEPHAGAAFV
jgi:hypothetical protein